jgi:hypothetical protein
MGVERPCYAMILETLAQVSAAQRPFFADNLEGFLKVLGMIAGFSGVVIGGVWKMLSSRLVGENKKLRTDLTGLGSESTRSRPAARQARRNRAQQFAELVRRADAKDVEFRGVTQDVARLEAKVDQAINQGTENKLEIIGEFQRAAEIIRTGQHKIELDFATLGARIEERDRIQKESRRAS